jgi:hypothetical protein
LHPVHSPLKEEQVDLTTMPRDETYIIDPCDSVLGLKASRRYMFDSLRGDPNERGTRFLLPVDAFYPTLSLVVEYDERQHTESVPFFDRKNTVSGITRGEQRRKYDLLKREFPAKNGMNLVVFSYQDFEHDSSKRLHRVAADRDVVQLKLQPFLADGHSN